VVDRANVGVFKKEDYIGDIGKDIVGKDNLGGVDGGVLW
jgi:hypothetical protein